MNGMASATKMFTNSCLRRLCVVKNHLALAKVINRATSASVTTAAKPRIHLSHSHARVDEKVCITVRGLKKGQKVTVQTFVSDGPKSFGSCGHYTADEDGHVNTFEHECQGGTFDGIEPMGLFWSMRSTPGNRLRRIVKTDVTSPEVIKIALHPGFLGFDDLPWTDTFTSLASCQFQQGYMGPGVKCIPVKEDGIQGILFLPAGEGPFPAVIDLFGMVEVFPGHRSALLASNGIASFVVGYVGHEGLAKSWLDLDLSYFLKAFDWLSRHPSVNPNAMGGLGSCVGGAYISLIAWKRPSMKCFAAINSSPWPSAPRQSVEGEVVEERPMIMDNTTVIDGAVSMKPLHRRAGKQTLFLPYWRHGAKVLHVQGEDDQCIDPEAIVFDLKNMPEKFRNNIKIVRYPGAGHIIEPPYLPLCRKNFNKLLNVMFLWGGQPKLHAHAQMESWSKIVSFLKENLTTACPSRETGWTSS